MRITFVACLSVLAAFALYLLVDFSGLMGWAIEQQRGFQNHMAAAVRGLRAGEAGAYAALLSATAAYGFVHALGPGHGKYLVGGVGLGTSISTGWLVGLAVASSVAQSLWAIGVVYGGFFLLEASADKMTTVTEDVLAPASYLAITCVGLALIWRGVRAIHRVQQANATCRCHSHGPTPEQAARVGSLREAAALVLSIAIRPCTGAVFLLVIAWQMDLTLPGATAVVVMGLGTALLTSLVALSSKAARGAASLSTGTLVRLELTLPALQISAGALIALISIGLLGL